MSPPADPTPDALSRAAVNPFPARPLAVTITASQMRLWSHVVDAGRRWPEIWEVSADVGPAWCEPQHRHVGDLEIGQVDLREELSIMDADIVGGGEWLLDFVDEAVVDPAVGKVHADLDALVGDGPPRMLILREITLAEAWRGHGLGGMLIASALLMLSPAARFAVCRVAAEPDRTGRPAPARRAGSRRAREGDVEAMLQRIGFQPWRGVHVAGLHESALSRAGIGVLEQWKGGTLRFDRNPPVAAPDDGGALR